MAAHIRAAGAVVLIRGTASPQVYWAERARDAAFLGGYRAFVGGKVDKGDEATPLAHPPHGAAERAALVAALRELYEETGVLVARLPDALSAERLAAARGELLAGRPFDEILRTLGAALDATLLTPAGRWVTPPFAARRFDTYFFMATLPDGQEPSLASDELCDGEWTRPGEAVAAWERAKCLVAPPVLHILRSLAVGFDHGLVERLHATPAAAGGAIERIEFFPGIVLVPQKTATIPPATHTNAYIVGRAHALILDPGSDDPAELDLLVNLVDILRADDVKPIAIVLTHHHIDHVAGAAALSERLRLPVAAHAETAARLKGTVAVTRLIADGERVDLGAGYALVAAHTPGHAPGHLCFFEERTGALLTGDNVLGLGTTLIDPPEGDMEAYIVSLRRLIELKPRAIFGGHGPALAAPEERLRALITHRLWREEQVHAAVTAGLVALPDIAAKAYADSPQAARALAERQTLAHLLWLERAGRVLRRGEAWGAA